MDKTVNVMQGFIYNRYNPLLLLDIKYDHDYRNLRELRIDISVIRIKYIFRLTFLKKRKWLKQ